MYRADTVTKSYGSTIALDNVSLEFRPGEVHALLGMNGAGKSTLVKILCGIEMPDQGRLELDGEEISLSSRTDALRHGIALVPQHTTLYPDLDLAANMFAGQERTRGPIIRSRLQRELTRTALDRVGLDRPVDTPAGRLSVGEAQLVEIARALRERPRVLFLDEPTAALPRSNRARLFELVRQIVAGGTAVILVTHFLDEALDNADRISVLRDRRVALREAPRADLSLQTVISEMTGPERVFEAAARREPTAPKSRAGRSPGLQLRDVTGVVLSNVSLEAVPGEIVGLAGLLGSGVDELIDVVVGSARPTSGSVVYPDGTAPRSVRSAVRSGLAYVPSDRGSRALMPQASLFENAALVRLGALTTPALRPIRLARERRRAASALDGLQTKYDRIEQQASSLSGGNQQKLVFAKWLMAGSEVFVLDDPTRAVDVHAKAEMHAVIGRLREAGKVILLASTDLEELEGVCDRVIVLAHGRLVGVLRREGDLRVGRMIELMSG